MGRIGRLTGNMVSVKMVIVAVLAAALAAGVAEGQSTASCVQKLTSCAPYLNGTSKPPATCCNPLKEAVAKEKACLCTVYNTPGLLPSLGVNTTQVATLAKSCGVDADASTICSASSPSPSPSATPAATPGNGTNASSRMVGIGMTSMFLLWAPLILC